MNALPPPLWSMPWQRAVLTVFSTADDSPVTMEDAATVISAGERARADRFHFSTDRERWIRSRALLRLSLAHRLSIPARSLTFQNGSHGKPSLPAHPGCHFSLSHSAGFTAIAVGPAPLGIDIESPREDFSAVLLAAHAFRPDETAAIMKSDAPHLLFYRMWTAKEAVMKCTGMGMSLPPDSIAIPCDENEFPGQATRLDDDMAFRILTHTCPGRFVLAAATVTAR